MAKRPITPAFVFFYILFLPDTWRILIGVLLSWSLTPRLIPADQDMLRTGMIYIMMAVIGYAVSGLPARLITRLFKKSILGK